MLNKNAIRIAACGLVVLGVLMSQVTFGQEHSEAPSDAIPGLTVTVDGVQEPVYKSGAGIKPPRPRHQPPAEYSEEARQKRIAGNVELVMVVTSKGDVTNIRVTTALGSGLDEKAIEAVRTWKFKPATRNGKPVSMLLQFEVAFHPGV